jgi:AraC-like DNA-binding protein
MLSRATREGQLVAGELLSLYDRRETLAPGEAEAAVDAVLDVVARAVGAARHATAAEYGERHLLTAAIKRHLDAHLTAEQIDVGALCRRFRLSRATLYRLFEPDGGLWRYVQDQRLNRAFARLATPGAPLERMIDLAIEFGFSSDTTFVRAFRHRHGLTPGEVRELAGSRTRPSAPHSQWTSGAWLQDLAQK